MASMASAREKAILSPPWGVQFETAEPLGGAGCGLTVDEAGGSVLVVMAWPLETGI